ncbi:MAG: ExeM/NucH family extracellular endonuclease, partial [Anaerolineales bacterium]|nr:ExeM/NucH family extracellular endonuclease [Anaerolineales bacterium]
NEIDYDQPGTDMAEFVEIRNNGATPTDLTGWTLDLINGNGTAVYGSFDLSGFTLAAGDYFVVCANNATVANCDLDVSPDTNLIQNGSPDAVALSFNGVLVDAVSYEGDTGAPYTEGSGAGLEDGTDGSISRCPDGADTNQNNVDLQFTGVSTPGAANECAPPPPPEMCGDPFTPIYSVQGSGLASPLVGTEVAVEGVVVGDFQNNASPDNGDLNGFHVQDPNGDGDPGTSDGVFVYAPTAVDVSVGDLVRVRGTVSEYNGMTEINATQVWQCASGGSVAPTAVSLPVASLDNLEAYEGMLVTFPQPLYIAEYFNFDRYGEIVLATDRQYTPTAVEEPGAPANALAATQALARITVDDGRTNQNPDPAIHPNGNIFNLDNRFRGGDLVQNVTGVMDYAFGLYRIQPTQGADYTPLNPRDTPSAVGGSLKVVSANVLNYFTTIDTGASICGPAQNQECRGADNQEEFDRQRAKIIAALSEINADVAGLIEIENTNSAAVADLVAGLNDALGAGTYAYIDTGTIGTDAIRVALIYKPASVTPLGSYAILDSSVDARFLDTKNRPALAQSFMQNSDGAVFTVAVNHLKSKGSDCNDVGDPDLNDGAGNCNLTRLAAAQALVDWLASDPTGSGDPDFLIIGDLNSYAKEDPIDAILAGSDDTPGTSDDYVNLVALFGGAEAYSYVFDGKLGYLDYALASSSLAAQVTGTTEWHNNADEPDILDYDTSFKQPAQAALYEPNAYRAADHDPVIVGLELNGPPVCSAAAASQTTLWPANHQMTAVTILGVTDPDGDPVTISIDAIYQDEPVNGSGDGDTGPDGAGIGTATALVRAERAGDGNGRYYHIFFTATDSFGNTCSGEVLVSVPKSQGRNGAAVDDGALYDSTLQP